MAATTSDVSALRVIGFRAGENVVFFGNTLGVECQRCGAYNQTTTGHKFCAHVSCPIALREFKRRKRKRTSSLEKVYLPAIQARVDQDRPPEDLADTRAHGHADASVPS